MKNLVIIKEMIRQYMEYRKDKKRMNHCKRYYRIVEKLVLRIEKDKFLNGNEKGRIIGLHLGGVKTSFKMKIENIENKYI